MCSNDTMKICYTPHAGVNLTTGMMATKTNCKTHCDNPACMGIPDNGCGQGNYGLALSLTDLKTCGTQKVVMVNIIDLN